MGIFDFLKRKSEGAVPQPSKEENYDVKLQDSEIETRDEEMSPDDGNQDTGTLMEAKDWLGMPPYLKTKVHGQTATLVDMLIELNKKMHFKSADEALEALFKYMEYIRTDGDKVAIKCSIYGLCKCAQYGFLNGHLDIDALKDALDDNVQYHVSPLSDSLEAVHNHYIYVGLDAVYNDYIIEKTIRLVEIMNAYRQYTNPQDLTRDFEKIVVSSREFSYWRKNDGDSYFGFGWIPVSYFKKYVKGFWGEFAPDGVMDNALFRSIMIERNAEEVKKNGLDVVVQKGYISGCYGYYPFSGVGPVYDGKEGGRMYPKPFRIDFDSWKFEKSCGDAGTHHDGLNELEISMILVFLRDELHKDWYSYSYGYIHNVRLMNACGEIYYGEPRYTIPKYDYSLPIYGSNLRRAFFKSKKEKIKFILEEKADMAKRVDPDSIPPAYLEKNRLRQELMELAESEEEREKFKEEFKFLFE